MAEGRVVSGDLMRYACDRHLRDIVDGPARGIYWRPELAARPLEFFPSVLTVTAGAHVGQPFNLPSWTTFAVGALFGWVNGSGRRRFRHAWWELSKGQIKSPVAAAIGIYTMGWSAIQRSEVYAIAKDRNQANVLFQDAASMCRSPIPGLNGDTLESLGDVVIRGTGEMSWMLEHPASGSKFRALAGSEGVNGPRPSLVLADEIHEWKSGQAIEVWQAALAKMPGDALMILSTNTPAADQIVGTEYSDLYQGILRGEIKDDAAFAIIARTDVGDDPMNDESCWLKSMPCLGLTYPIENVRGEVASANGRIAKALSVKRLYFGIPVGASEYWIDLESWEAVQGEVDTEELKDLPCWLALDLSRKNDLTALAQVWKHPDGRLIGKVKYWKPKDGSAGLVEGGRTDRAPYQEWVIGGFLNVVPGHTISYDFVAVEIQRIVNTQSVQSMVYDPAYIKDFTEACVRIGLPVWDADKEEYGTGLRMVKHAQGRMGMHSKSGLWMPRSLLALEDAIANQEIIIDENPVTNWCSGNAAIEADAQDNRYFVKKRTRGRIDGLVALAMGVGAASAASPDMNAGRSYLETDDLLIF